MSVRDNKYIPEVDKDFFILLRIGLWQEVAEGDELSPSPDWEYIYKLACEQTVQGIITDGIGLYRKANGSLNISQEQNDRFLSASAQVMRRNWTINQKQAELCQLFNEQQITYVVLKGQGIAQSYPKPMLRCSGDIDYFFTPDNYQRAKELLIPLSATVEDKPLSLECALTIDGVDVELHGAMTSGINRYCDQHLQVVLDKVLTQGDTRIVTINGSSITLPSANFDALYILIHTIRHLGAFGISLRQVIDWVMLVHSCNDNTSGEPAASIDNTRLQQDLKAMYLQNLWNLFMSFAVVYLGAPAESLSLTTRQATLSRLWLHIKASGSFGHKNEYYTKKQKGRLWERYYRIYYWLQSDIKLYHYDTRYATHRLLMILKDTFKAPFRYLFGGPTQIYDGQQKH